MLEHTLPMSWAIAFRDMLTFPASRTANSLRTVLQEVGRKRVLPDVSCILKKAVYALSKLRGSSMLRHVERQKCHTECQALHTETGTATSQSQFTLKA